MALEETESRPLACGRVGAGPAVALVHGFTQTGASWARVAERLAGEFEVLTPDLPGHGASPPATGDLYEAARSLGRTCGEAVYVGYSFGGRVCLHLALARPDLVRALVLVSTTAGIDDLDERAARRHADDALAARIEERGDEGLDAFLDEWLAGPLFAHLDEKAADRAARRANRAAGLAGSLRAHGTGAQLPLWERLGEIEVPVLVLAGSEDAKFCDLGRRLAAAVGSGATFVLVPGAGHALAFEEPEGFAQVVADFARHAG